MFNKEIEKQRKEIFKDLAPKTIKKYQKFLTIAHKTGIRLGKDDTHEAVIKAKHYTNNIQGNEKDIFAYLIETGMVERTAFLSRLPTSDMSQLFKSELSKDYLAYVKKDMNEKLTKGWNDEN